MNDTFAGSNECVNHILLSAAVAEAHFLAFPYLDVRPEARPSANVALQPSPISDLSEC